MDTVKLNNGSLIPQMGYGSSIVNNHIHNVKSFLRECKISVTNKRQHKLNTSLAECVNGSMKNHLNMFDTSMAYGQSEIVIGKTLKKYKREDYFIVTKLCNRSQYDGNIRKAMEESLRRLNVEYVDMYLMHWPVTDIYLNSWKEMEKLYEEGLCKAIGVCNCEVNHLNELEKVANIIPAVNQIECHPLFTQDSLREYCNEKNIKVMAYTPTARMDERLRKTVIVPIAKKYNKSMAQIILRWHIQIGNIPIVNSNNPKHIIENMDIFDFELTEDEVAKILRININSRLRYDPNNCDFRQL